ncbi:hypothetical protein CEXT_807961 [Caerostris extrusa]|uniref:Uncharacterized protein n=1 Tax=Caerostris extrusa TaxID=172846 RepID=A0AAV4N0M8_CAEEX|nr:hypothetical protein CEXT_807961 [Caerostris extrusa]
MVKKPHSYKPNVVFQQDGAPPLRSSFVCRSLDETFPQLWIGEDGPTVWPQRSPEIPHWISSCRARPKI